jgi:hypothetical protein
VISYCQPGTSRGLLMMIDDDDDDDDDDGGENKPVWSTLGL